MVEPVRRGGRLPLSEDSVTGSVLPEAAMRLTSTATAEAAAKRFQQLPAAEPSKLKAAGTLIETTMADFNPVVEVLVDARDFVRTAAIRINKYAACFFEENAAWQHLSVIDAWLFNIISLFRRSLAFGVSVKEASEFWIYCNISEKLKTLSDLTFKGVKIGESLLGLSAKVTAILQIFILAFPITCVSIITSTIMSMKALVLTIKLEVQRREVVKALGDKEGTDRLKTAIAFCERHAAALDRDNTNIRTNLLSRGAPAASVERFLVARKKWTLSGIFGSKSYPAIFQGFKRLELELTNLEAEIKILIGQNSSPERDAQLEFLMARKEALMLEGNKWIDKFLATMRIECAQIAVTFIGNLVVVVAGLITLVATLVTIEYWAFAVISIVMVASFLGLISSLYTLWQRQRISWQEKEDTISLITAHFVKVMRESQEPDRQKLAATFGFSLNRSLSAELTAKQFEEHLKGLLHDEKVQKFIDKKLVDVVRTQVQMKGARRSISVANLKTFENDLSQFFQKVVNAAQVKQSTIEQTMIDLSAKAKSGKELFEKLSDSFFFYLNQLCPDVAS